MPLTNLENIHQGVETFLAAGWTATPVAWAGYDFDPRAIPEWIRPEILVADAFRETLNGTPVVGQRMDLILVIQIFVREDTGQRRLAQLGDLARNLFNEATIPLTNPVDNVICFAPTITAVGTNEGFGAVWRQLNVEIPFLHRDT